MDIILSTRNRSKIQQVKELFKDLHLTILSLDEAGIKEDALENGKTCAENALKKAFFIWSKTRAWTIADDTGLFIDALGGLPGVHAGRWAGVGAKTEDTLNFTLEKLKDIPLHSRTATFVTVAAVVPSQGEPRLFEGSVKGYLLTKPRVAHQPHMPYSSIFLPNGYEKVFAEMTIEEENKMSHRGQAFRQARKFISENLL